MAMLRESTTALDPPRQPCRRLLDLFEIAVEAEPEEAGAVRAECRARRQPDVRAVDDVESGLPRIRDAVDRKEQIEGALRYAESRPARLAQNIANEIAGLAGALDLLAQECIAVVECSDGAALHELRHARPRILHQALENLLQRRLDAQPADTPAGHCPILGAG